MAKIRNRRTIQGVVDELKLQREREAIPEEILTKIVPTFDVAEKGIFKVLVDQTANDSSKSFTVPSGQYWEIENINVRLGTTATVGNRLVRVVVDNAAGSEIFYMRADSTQAASSTGFYMFSPMIATIDNSGGQQFVAPCIKTVVAGDVITVEDGTGVDAAADDMWVSIFYKEFTLPTEEE